ncbi:MAG: ribbon-helix-helix domain-containing protein [Candidatus Bathyarchaeia archaeon]
MTDDLEKKLREYVKEKYGNKKGALSIVVEEAIKKYLSY